MKRFLVMFMAGDEQELANSLDRLGIEVRERYAAFLVVDATDAAARALRARFIVQEVELLAARDADTSGTDRLPAGPHHWLVRFIGPVKRPWLSEVRKAGGQPLEPRGVFTHVVRADKRAIRRIAALDKVAGVSHLRYEDRITGEVRSGADCEVEFFRDEQAKQAVKEIEALGFEVVAPLQERTLQVRPVGRGTRKFDQLTRVHGVRQVRERALAELANDVALRLMATTVAMGTGQAVGGQGLGLSGRGQVVAICDGGLDTGDICKMHPDLAGRVDGIFTYPPGADARDVRDGHGTHIAGSVLGDGKRSGGDIRGPAYRARLLFQATQGTTDPGAAFVASGIPTEKEFGKLLEDAYRRGARVHVDAFELQRDGDRGEYDLTCHALDKFVWQHKDFCVVVAAGNLKAPEHLLGDADRVAPPGTSKNCITVGASESCRPDLGLNYHESPVFKADTKESRRRRGLLVGRDPDQISPLSRRGPTSDRRNKPEVVTPGTCILSTRSRILKIAPGDDSWLAFPGDPEHYAYLGGTSQATALTAGAVTLLREYFVTRCGVAEPTAALLKAALIAGATLLPAGKPHPEVVDQYQGYGRVNLDAVLAPANGASMRFEEIKPGFRKVIKEKPYQLEIDIQPGAAPFRIVLAYTDYPGYQTQNCLNLLVCSPRGRKPLMGNSRAGGPRVPDTRNNVEVVHVARPRPGRWRVQVSAVTILHPPQPFALVYLANL